MVKKHPQINQQQEFPYARLLIGAFLGAFITNYRVSAWYPSKGIDVFILSFLIAGIIGLIPMFIAYDRKNQNANVVYWFAFAAMCMPFGILWFIIALCMAFSKTKIGSNKTKTAKYKIEIVNNAKYINLKKSDRILFLKKLKKQTVAELTKVRKELEKETNKLKDIPDDVAKYVKKTDTSSLEKTVLHLDSKIVAINELIEAETTKLKHKQGYIPFEEV